MRQWFGGALQIAGLFFYLKFIVTMADEILRLPLRFHKNGFNYWQICRTDKAAIYEQRTTDGQRVFYEVWRIRIRPSYTFNGREYGVSERSPGSENWGRDGWTFYTLPDAQKRYDLLNGNGSIPDGDNTRVLAGRVAKQ